MKDKGLIKAFGRKYDTLCDEFVLEAELKKFVRRHKFDDKEKLVIKKSRKKLIERCNIESALTCVLLVPLWKKTRTQYDWDHPEETMRRNLGYLTGKRDYPVEYREMLLSLYGLRKR